MEDGRGHREEMNGEKLGWDSLTINLNHELLNPTYTLSSSVQNCSFCFRTVLPLPIYVITLLFLLSSHSHFSSVPLLILGVFRSRYSLLGGKNPETEKRKKEQKSIFSECNQEKMCVVNRKRKWIRIVHPESEL